MHVQLAKKALADALQHVERIIPNRSSNPGTSLLRIDLQPDALRLQGTNLELDVEATIPADVRDQGTIAVPAQVFAQVVRALPGDVVTLNVEASELTLSGGDFATRLQLADPSNLPTLEFPSSYAGRLPATEFSTVLGSVRYASAVAEYQAIFRGVKLEFSNERTRAIATDGFRLAYADANTTSGLDAEVIIPARTVDEIIKAIGTGDVEIAIDDAHVSLKTPTMRFNAKRMDGTFPDYRRVIPSVFPVAVTLDADELRDAVGRVAVMADKTANNRVDLFIKDGTLQITAEGAYGHSQEALSVQQEGSDPEIALAYNAKYLTDALGPLQGVIRAAFSGATTPSLLSHPDRGDYLAMVVPLRTG